MVLLAGKTVGAPGAPLPWGSDLQEIAGASAAPALDTPLKDGRMRRPIFQRERSESGSGDAVHFLSRRKGVARSAPMEWVGAASARDDAVRAKGGKDGVDSGIGAVLDGGSGGTRQVADRDNSIRSALRHQDERLRHPGKAGGRAGRAAFDPDRAVF